MLLTRQILQPGGNVQTVQDVALLQRLYPRAAKGWEGESLDRCAKTTWFSQFRHHSQHQLARYCFACVNSRGVVKKC